MLVRALRFGILAVLFALLAGCTGEATAGHTPSPSAPATGTTTPPEPTSIQVAAYGDKEQLSAYHAIVAAFLAQHSGVTIRLTTSTSWPAAEAKIADLAAKGKLPDVFLADHVALPTLVADGSVAPLGDALVARNLDFGDGYLRNSVVAFSSKDNLQCMPNDVSPYVVFYNKQLVRLHHLAVTGEQPPTAANGWTWAQFLRAARRAARAGAAGVYVPPDLDLFGALVKAAGGSFMDNDRLPTTVGFTQDSSTQAVGQVLGLVRNARLSVTSAQLAEATPEKLFAEGKLAMLVGTRTDVPALRASGLAFDVMPLPKIQSVPSMTVMNGWCVASTSPAFNLSADFVAFAVGPEGAQIAASSGAIVPSNTTALASPAFDVPGEGPDNGFVFLDSVQRSPLPPDTSLWEQARTAAEPYLEKLYYGPEDHVASNLVELVAKVTVALTPPAGQGS